jgi:hypothetical protein
MGTASAHLVLLSIIVKRWEKPPLTIGRGPHQVDVHIFVFNLFFSRKKFLKNP